MEGERRCVVQESHDLIGCEWTIYQKHNDHESDGILAAGITDEPEKAKSLAETTLAESGHAASMVKNPAHGLGGTVDVDPQLIAFMLPSIPESVRIARFHIRAALGFHRLGEYADDAETITSELVTNAIQHVGGDGTETVGVSLVRVRNPEAVTVVVSDSSPAGPVIREPSDSSERGRGLLIVDELSAYWGWNLEDGGKSVFAILAKEAGT
jgi:anti-sigma regulatory factor (Ser/Thr protein kinase)